ncbi:MAG: hypothetical protein Q8R10_04015 [Pseudomonas sp.]|uniref:hypothetical protein n=1 Tax=Pseudomonas sp. TaxID=306 RepID=UPI0027340189|nr:hypothetical protein [Pseudomonas sp.]MDP3845571.1 hypothetical protein [Pseudomonas sp.]
MDWFRQQRRGLLRLTLAVWLLALLVAVAQGCLVQPRHDLAAPHASLLAAQQVDQHTAHASGCLQHCADAAVVISPALQLPTLGILSWGFLLLLPALALLAPANISTFAFLALRRRVPPEPPARLLFVRFND